MDIISMNYTEVYNATVSGVTENYEAGLILVPVALVAYGVYLCCCSRPNPGLDFNRLSPGNGDTPLIKAIKIGDFSDVKKMVGEGADLEVCNLEGQTPLHVACKKGRQSIVSFLLENNANPIATANKGWTPLMYAAKNKTSEAAKEILSRLNLPQINAQNADGQTALHIAAKKGNLLPLNALLEKGANANIFDNEGNLSLHAAAQGAHRPIFEKVFDKTEDPNTKNGEAGETPLHIFVRQGRVPEGEYLRKLDPNLSNEKGEYPLHLAMKRGNDAALALLEHPNIDVDVQDEKGNTPAHLAIDSGRRDVLQKLREKGANFTLANEKGDTLFVKALKKEEDIQSFLADKSSEELQEMKVSGIGLAEYAAAKGLSEMLAFLREKGIHFSLTEENKEPLILEMRKTALDTIRAAKEATGIKIQEVDDLIVEIENPEDEKSSILEHLDLSIVYNLERISLQEKQKAEGRYDEKTELIGAILPLRELFQGLTGPRKEEFLSNLDSYMQKNDMLNALKERVYPIRDFVRYLTEIFQAYVPSNF